MNVYRIRDWSAHFEHGDMRKVHRMTWVKLSTKQDGDGYRSLIDHPNGWTHLGLWTALLQLAAKCALRGTLVRDLGAGGLQPHDATTIARIIGAPAEAVAEVLPRLVAIGWVEEVSLEDALDEPTPKRLPKSSDDRQKKDVLQGQGQGQGQEEEARPRADDDPASSALPDGSMLSEPDAAQLRVVVAMGGSLWLAAKGGRGARRDLRPEWLRELRGYAQDRIVGTLASARPALPSEFRRAVAPHLGERVDPSAASREASAREERRQRATAAREEREAADRQARALAGGHAAAQPIAEAFLASLDEPGRLDGADAALMAAIADLRAAVERRIVSAIALKVARDHLARFDRATGRQPAEATA